MYIRFVMNKKNTSKKHKHLNSRFFVIDSLFGFGSLFRFSKRQESLTLLASRNSKSIFSERNGNTYYFAQCDAIFSSLARRYLSYFHILRKGFIFHILRKGSSYGKFDTYFTKITIINHV